MSQPDCNVGFAEDVFVISCTAACDAFDKLYRDPELRQRMGEAARKRIGTHFRNEDTVKKTIALYEEIAPIPD